MVRKRWKRKSGWVTPRSNNSVRELENYGLFLQAFYDEWNNYRDGFRNWFSDFKLIKKVSRKRIITAFNAEVIDERLRMNNKQKRLLKRRIRRKRSWKQDC